MRRAVAVVTVVTALAALSGACGASAATVEIDVGLLAGQAWTARGGAVDAGVMCAAGGRQTVEFRDPDTGEPLPLPEVMARMETWEPGEPGTLAFVIEMTCADGSGTLTVHENGRDEVWKVLHGTGAFDDVDGNGSFTVEYFDASAVEQPSDDDPPDGAPIALHWTGEMSKRGDR